MYRVAVIILNYNTWEDTLNEIELVYNICNIPMSDIVVIDNASPNEERIQLKKKSKEKGFIFIQATQNKGYAAGNNIGLGFAISRKYQYAWILNNDIYFDDTEIINKLYSVFEKDNMIATVNPDIFAPSGHMFNRDAKRPSFFDFTLGMNRYRKIGRQINVKDEFGYVYRPQGCCMMVDLQKMKAVHLLDEHTFLYFEEPILAERLLQKGFRCACCVSASVIHNHSKSVKTVFQKQSLRKIQNKSFEYYLNQYRGYGKFKSAVCVFFNTLKLQLLQG